ncbi:MAG: HAD-IIB family hydrolase [Actinomycetota bacterium]
MNVRLIATDLDGTFFGAEHRPEARSVAAMNAAQAAGIICVAVTGRSHMGGAPLATSTGADLDWFIGSNGGHRLNLRTREMEERLLFQDADVGAIRASLEAEDDGFAFGWEARDQLVWEAPFVELSPNRLTGTALKEEDRLGDGTTPNDVGKMFVAHPDLGHASLIDRLQPHVGDHHATSSGINFAEITPSGADKGAALARLCAQLDIVAEEVVAFGDNLNDLTMLTWAGRGVAMGNALDEVKSVADEVTSTNVDFGVARILEELV